MMSAVRTTWRLAVAAALAGCTPAVTAGPAIGPDAGPAAPSISAPELTRTLDSIMRDAYPADQPGATAIVVRHGEVLLRGGYGVADLELGVPMRPDHVFRLGSITKQFTGVAILMLAEEGALSLDDPITRFLPDYPLDGRTVTVEHLLGHTSGIRSYTGMPEWRPTTRTDLSVSELIAFFQDQPFDFEPGERWLYNNSGYVLLGAVIERVSGMSYADFVRTRIFEPLEMTASRYGEAETVIPNRIPGYSRRGEAWYNAEFISMTHPYAAGSLLSSVDDLARWDAAITRGELLGGGGWHRAFTPVRLSDGRSTGYAAGWMLGRIGELETAEHGGGIPGFITNAIRVPEAGLFVAVLANADTPVTSPSAVSLRLADIVLGGVVEQPAIELDAGRLREYVGVYRIDDSATRTISLEGDRLYSQRSGGSRLEVIPIDEDLFLFAETGTRLRFVRDGGQVTAMMMEPRLGMPERAERTNEAAAPRRQAVSLPSASYDAYPGIYRLAPQFAIRIWREGDQLYGQATGQSRVTLLPQSPTRFFLLEVDATVDFTFEDGRVTGLTLHQGGSTMQAPRVD
jgi:D-alanyl-D-alanine carboxypeptidase